MKTESKFSKSMSTGNLNIRRGIKILNKDDLIFYIYKLKIHLNNVLMIKKNNIASIKKMKSEEIQYGTIIQEKDQNYAFEILPAVEDNVSLFSLEVKEELVKKVENLMKLKDDYLDKQNMDNEYRNSLLKMIDNEKLNLAKINQTILKNDEHRANIKLSKVNIINNETEKNKIVVNLSKMSKSLSNDVSRMNNLIYMQTNHIDNLITSIQKKRIDMNKGKNTLNEKNKHLEIENKIKKDEIMNKIFQMERLKSSNMNQENYIIKIIFGLDLIQKYLLKSFENPKEATRMLYESIEYSVFVSEKFMICDENLNSTKKGKFLNSEESKSKINLSDIKRKFDNLTIEYDDIFDLYSKIVNKKIFNHNIMTKYNIKQIRLESGRESYSKRIQGLVSKHYKNLDDLIKSNSKVEALMNKFQCMNYNYQKESKMYSFDNKNVDNRDFFEKCSKLIYEVKSFLDNIHQNFENPEFFKDYSEDINDEINELIHKTKDFFKYVVDSDTNSREDYIRSLFKDVEQFLNINKDEWLNKKISLKYENDIEINDRNIGTYYNNLKSFYINETEIFNLINLEYNKSIYYNLCQIDKIKYIIGIIVKLLTKINSTKTKIDFKINPSNDDLTSNLNKNSLKKMSTLFKSNNETTPEKEEEDDHLKSEEDDKYKVKKKVEKTQRTKLNSFLHKMYEPYVEKKNFIRSLNENVCSIKRNTRLNKENNFKLYKKQNDIDRLSNELILFNNPKINLNRLSNNTYNSFVKYIISSQIELSKNKSVEDFPSLPRNSKKQS